MTRDLDQYRPFIDDATHISDLDRQRFVVLRMPPRVTRPYRQVQDAVRQRMSTLPISYPARPHVTLCGFVAGTPLDAVQEVVGSWSRSTPSLSIEIERTGVFPPPFQIVTIQVRRTPELFTALTRLRRQAEQRRLTPSTLVPVEQWIFHMSVAYCSGLSSEAWHDVERFIDVLEVPSATCVVDEAEVVAFDLGREYSGGVFPLNLAHDTH